ncbi:Hypothetical predicted protein [Mytilus galloprovincialis]|nr:Hypothetical predicted protein [Mytilus galloprovincialis]
MVSKLCVSFYVILILAACVQSLPMADKTKREGLSTVELNKKSATNFLHRERRDFFTEWNSNEFDEQEENVDPEEWNLFEWKK